MIPSSPVAFWHYFDFITLTALVTVITLLVKSHHKSTGGLLGSISQTVAYSRKSSIIFSVTMTIFFPLYYAYIWFWVLPTVAAPHWLYITLAISALSEMVFVWVPATVARSKRIHEFTAGIVGIFMWLLPLLILLEGNNLNITSRISLIITLITPFVLLISMLNRRLRKYTFIYEVIYCCVFLATLSVLGHS